MRDIRWYSSWWCNWWYDWWCNWWYNRWWYSWSFDNWLWEIFDFRECVWKGQCVFVFRVIPEVVIGGSVFVGEDEGKLLCWW